jgi:hypothetical protein
VVADAFQLTRRAIAAQELPAMAAINTPDTSAIRMLLADLRGQSDRTCPGAGIRWRNS